MLIWWKKYCLNFVAGDWKLVEMRCEQLSMFFSLYCSISSIRYCTLRWFHPDKKNFPRVQWQNRRNFCNVTEREMRLQLFPQLLQCAQSPQGFNSNDNFHFKDWIQTYLQPDIIYIFLNQLFFVRNLYSTLLSFSTFCGYTQFLLFTTKTSQLGVDLILDPVLRTWYFQGFLLYQELRDFMASL